MGIEMFIPERLIDKTFDAVSDVLASQIQKIPGGDKIARRIKGLHSKSESRNEFSQALQDATSHFVDDYKLIDEDLVNSITDQKDFLLNEDVQNAFINILKRPDRYLEKDESVVQKYFDSIFPERINRERVNSAVSYFLKCLAESVWLLPEFGAIYSLLFQKATAESVHKQALMAETQVRLTQEVRDVLLQLTEIIQTQHQLPLKQSPQLQSGLEGITDVMALSVSGQIAKAVKVDLGYEFFKTEQFYGRQKQIDELKSLTLDSGCRLVGVFGLGGIGKSAITIKVVNQIQNEFEYIFGRSLLNPKPLAAVLIECIQFLSNQSETNLPENIEKLLPKLVSYLRRSRCLIVLDNFEGIIKAGETGQFRDGYQDYGKLLALIGESDHNSCLLITSREKPVEFSILEGDNSAPVQALHLSGLTTEEGKQILHNKALKGNEDQVANLVNSYSGNPLALLIVSDMIRTVYGGQISDFLKEEGRIFGKIQVVLEEAFERSSELDQKLMFWLAIEREPVTRDELFENIIQRSNRPDLMVALRSLIQRSLVEQGGQYIKLQNLVMEYITALFISKVFNELELSAIEFFKSHALIKAQSKDYVRQMQENLILKPLVDNLMDTYQRKEIIAEKLLNFITVLRNKKFLDVGYAVGNILNIMTYLKCDFSNIDLSHLVVRQANLQGTELPGVNFSYSDLATSVFTETFASILSVNVSPKGNYLAAGCIDGNVYVWELPAGKLIQILHGHTDWVRGVSFSHDGKTLASCAYDQTIKLWDMQSGTCIETLVGHSTWVTSIDFHPDDKLLVSCSLDNTIRIWNISTGKTLRTIIGHQGGVQSVRYSPDGKLVASASSDNSVKLWNSETGECIKTFEGHSSQVWSIDFSPDGLRIVSGSHDQTVRLWEIATGNCRVLAGHIGWVISVAFNAAGDKIVSGSYDQTVRLWDANSGECLKTLTEHVNWVWAVDFNPANEIVISGSSDQTVRFWDAKSGHCLKVLKGHDMAIKSVAFSPDSSLVASAGNDRIIRLWDTKSGKSIMSLKGHSRQIWSVSFSPRSPILASGGEDQVVRIWSLESGDCIKVLEGHESWVYVSFNTDGSLLASSGTDDKTIRIWNTSTWELIRIIDTGSRVWTVDFSANGKYLACANYDKIVRIWDPADGKLLKELHGHEDQVWSVNFNPDNTLLATAGEDKTIRIWDTKTWDQKRILTGHESWILTAIFGSKGSLIASEGLEDDTIRIWDPVNGDCINILRTYKPWSIAFNSIGDLLASGSYDGNLRIWRTDNGQLVSTFEPQKLYEKMNITGAMGLTEMQKSTLVALGASLNL